MPETTTQAPWLCPTCRDYLAFDVAHYARCVPCNFTTPRGNGATCPEPKPARYTVELRSQYGTIRHDVATKLAARQWIARHADERSTCVIRAISD